MTDDLSGLLRAMADGRAPLEGVVDCPACMGTAKVRFEQSADDPSKVHAFAGCIHCHDEGDAPGLPLTDPLRTYLLRTEGTWTLTLKTRAKKSVARARKIAGRTGASAPLAEGTPAEINHLASRLRSEDIPFRITPKLAPSRS